MKKLFANLDPNWHYLLNNEFEKEYFMNLSNFIENEYKNHTIFPPKSLIFNALNYTNFNKVKVVILGQDPYHGVNQADGLCFSVADDVPVPPSLNNIFKEIKLENGIYNPENGNLIHWAKQGILLLNSVLTVRAMQPNSHPGNGWETFTDQIIKLINNHKSNIVFMLWGSYAQKKSIMIDHSKHLILKAPHPSPLSAYRGFLGCNHFKLCNEYLQNQGIVEINW